MFSMTGYGRATLERDGRQLTIEIKTVNHRFLDASLRMPRVFNFLEDEMRKQLAARLARGHADLFVTYRNMREDARTVTVDESLFNAYSDALRLLAEEGDTLRDDRSLMSVARMPDVLAVSEAEEDEDVLRMMTRETMKNALDMLCAMRAREGQSLKDDLITRLSRLEKMVADIRVRYPDTVREYEVRLRDRIHELLETPVDEARLIQEVAIMADRSAISEELVRLDSHIAQMRETMESAEPVGRKLDFIVQELNREVNTISSKSQDIPITQIVVSAKAEIEKMREQVQNVE